MDITGYDIVATFVLDDHLHTQVLVLNNNSSHFIVVSRLDETTTEARKLTSFAYDGEDAGPTSARHAFRSAVDAAAAYVLEGY